VAIDLGSIDLLDLDDQPWTLAIPPITGQSQTIARTGLGIGAQALNYQFTADGSGQTNWQGHLRYQVSAAGIDLGSAFGQIVQTGGGFSCLTEIFNPRCQTLFVADDDLFGANQEPLGRPFCIQCNDLSLFFDTSPVLWQRLERRRSNLEEPGPIALAFARVHRGASQRLASSVQATFRTKSKRPAFTPSTLLVDNSNSGWNRKSRWFPGSPGK
jgi:hypothetical protein